MMSGIEHLFLSDAPLSENEVGVETLDIISEETAVRGHELETLRIVEGKITHNAKHCPFYYLPVSTGPSPIDRTKWDLYLFIIPFSLHPAREGTHYREMTFIVKMQDEACTAFDLFPASITSTGEDTKTYRLSTEYKIRAGDEQQLCLGRYLHFANLQPIITILGEGESTFYWIYTRQSGHRGLLAGTRHALVVLQVPYRTEVVDALIEYKITVNKRWLDVLSSRECNIAKQPVRWFLRDAPPFFSEGAPAPSQHTTSVPQRTSLQHGVQEHVTPNNAAKERFQAVILTAIPAEYQAARAHLQDLQEREHRGTIFEVGHFEQMWTVAIAEIGAGNSSAAMTTERAIALFHPDIVLFVGVAGGLKDVRLGDVVAVTKVYGYEAGKVEATGFRPRPSVFNSTYDLEQRARNEARKQDWLHRLPASSSINLPRAYIGAIATGEKVLASSQSEVWRVLKQSYGDALAVEMEGHGVLQSLHANHHTQGLIIRGISDLIDNKLEADAADWQQIAAQNASAFAYEILAKIAQQKY